MTSSCRHSSRVAATTRGYLDAGVAKATGMLSCAMQGAHDERLLQLAAAARMNTDTRRAVFCAVMGSEDATDAFERLLRLSLKARLLPLLRSHLRHCLCCYTCSSRALQGVSASSNTLAGGQRRCMILWCSRLLHLDCKAGGPSLCRTTCT